MVVCNAYVGLPPSLEIEDVHPVGPSALVRVEAFRDQRVRKVQVALESL